MGGNPCQRRCRRYDEWGRPHLHPAGNRRREFQEGTGAAPPDDGRRVARRGSGSAEASINIAADPAPRRHPSGQHLSERNSVVKGTMEAVSVYLVGGRIIKKKKIHT